MLTRLNGGDCCLKVAGLTLVVALTGSAWAAGKAVGTPTQVGAPVVPLKVTGDPAKLKPSGPATSTRSRTIPEGEPLPTGPATKRPPKADPKAQLSSSTSSSRLTDAGSAPGQISAPVVSVAGATDNSNPPDMVGDIGRDHFIQMSNGSAAGSTGFFILRKDGTAPPARPAPALSGSGPFVFGALWPAGQACNNNLGDPIVVYDHIANRWLLSQFNQPGGGANPGFLCVAISQTADPTDNQWFLYQLQLLNNALPDYPKIGVWPDGYYVTTYESPSLGLYVLDRANMLLGNAAGFLRTTIPALSPAAGVRDTRVLPADLDGAAPPAGAPGLFVRTVDDQQDTSNATDRVEVYEGAVNWQTSAFNVTLVDTITPTAFDIMTCNRGGGGIRSCLPQPGVTDTLDALSNRPMMQLKYRNFGTHQSLVFNQTIDVQGSVQAATGIVPANEVAGVRWTELRKSGANWALQQDGTYGPQPNGASSEAQLLHRWMGSTAMDRFGNIGLAYNIVDGTALVPGLRYTGRTPADVASLMPQGEQTIATPGSAAIDNGNATVEAVRWGDYSALSVDPVDDCTFWYTSHAGGSPRVSRVASFRFSDCATDLSVAKSGSPNVATAGSLLTYTLTAVNRGPLNASGVQLVDTLPAGITYVSDNGGCTRASNVLTCTIGSLNVDEVRTVQVLVKVNAGVVSGGASTITNTVTISSDQGEANPADNTATLITQVVDSADLRISKQCKPDQPAPSGSNATCTLFVDNLGPSDARQVSITDTHLSNGAFTITSAGYAAPTTPCGIAGGVVTCLVPTLAAGAGVTVTVNFTATGNIDVNDTARVTSATPDPNTLNNTATGKVSFVANSDLALVKTASTATAVAGTNLTYTLTVTNNGPAVASNVTVADVLPIQVQLLSATPSIGSCGGTTVPGDPAQPLTCNFGTLANGASATLSVNVKVNSETPQGQTLVNNAGVASDVPDPNNANNKATVITPVNAVADLVTLKTSDKAQYKPSSLVTYTVNVTNGGPSKAIAVKLVDTLPDAKQAIYQSDTGGCTKSGGTLTCVLGDMAVGASRSFNVYMVIKGSRGNVVNTATASSSTTEGAAANNTSALTVKIGN